MPKGKRSTDSATVREGQQYVQRIDAKNKKVIKKSRKSTAQNVGPRAWGTRKWCLENRVGSKKRQVAPAAEEASAAKKGEDSSK